MISLLLPLPPPNPCEIPQAAVDSNYCLIVEEKLCFRTVNSECKHVIGLIKMKHYGHYLAPCTLSMMAGDHPKSKGTKANFKRQRRIERLAVFYMLNDKCALND